MLRIRRAIIINYFRSGHLFDVSYFSPVIKICYSSGVVASDLLYDDCGAVSMGGNQFEDHKNEKGKLRLYAMKRVATGAHLPTPRRF